MTHAPPPKPAWVAPSPTPYPTLADVEIIAQGVAYHVPVVGIPCSSQTMFVTRVVRRPSQRMTVVVSCDGAGASLEVNDDAVTGKRR
jgi:hypothetical protein